MADFVLLRTSFLGTSSCESLCYTEPSFAAAHFYGSLLLVSTIVKATKRWLFTMVGDVSRAGAFTLSSEYIPAGKVCLRIQTTLATLVRRFESHIIHIVNTPV